jgi:hypothetical protein
MKKAIIVYISTVDAYKAKKRTEVLAEALIELNEHLANGWSVEHASPLGTGSEVSACSLVVLKKCADKDSGRRGDLTPAPHTTGHTDP